MSKTTAIYVRRSVSDADKGNNSLSIFPELQGFCVKIVQKNHKFCKRLSLLTIAPHFHHMIFASSVAKEILTNYATFLCEWFFCSGLQPPTSPGLVAIIVSFERERIKSILLRDKNIRWKKMERVISSYIMRGNFCVKSTSQCCEIQ